MDPRKKFIPSPPINFRSFEALRPTTPPRPSAQGKRAPYHDPGVCELDYPDLAKALNLKLNEVKNPGKTNQQRIQEAITQLNGCITARIKALTDYQIKCVNDWRLDPIPLCGRSRHTSPYSHIEVIERLILLEKFLRRYPPEKGQLSLRYVGEPQALILFKNVGATAGEIQPDEHVDYFIFPKNHFGEEPDKANMTELREEAKKYYVQQNETTNHYRAAYQYLTERLIDREKSRGKSLEQIRAEFQTTYGFPIDLTSGGRRKTKKRKQKYRLKSV
jgi:hypothetical protein